MVALDGNSAGLTFLIIQAIFTPLAAIAVAFRLRARRITAVSLEFSDYAIIIALFFVLVEAAVGLVGVLCGGAGLHTEALTPQQLVTFHQTLFGEDGSWMVGNCFIKLSVLHFLNSIFRRKPWFPRSTYPLMIVVGLACFACLLSRFFMCRPLTYTWNRTIPGGTCISLMPMSPGAATISLVLDVIILVLPIPVILGLQMRATKKVLLVGIFGMGVVICVISGLRIASIVTANLNDPAYSSVFPSQWSILDNTLGIVSACLPLFTPFYMKSAARNRRSDPPTMNHSPSSSTSEPRHSARQGGGGRPSGDMTSLAWGGANRTGASDGGILNIPPRSARLDYERPHAYRCLGSRDDRALGPPVALNHRLFDPPGVRDGLAQTGSASSRPTSLLFSSIPPSHSISQRQDPQETRAPSGIGSRVVSRMGSHHGSRSNSRIGQHSDEVGGHDLTNYNQASDGVENGSKSRVAITSHGRRSSEGVGEEATHDSKGITVTTTWDVDVESLRSDDEPCENDAGREGSYRSHGTPTFVDTDHTDNTELH